MTEAERRKLLEQIAEDTRKARTMSPEEARRSLVAEGLCDEHGVLTTRYGGKAAIAIG